MAGASVDERDDGAVGESSQHYMVGVFALADCCFVGDRRRDTGVHDRAEPSGSDSDEKLPGMTPLLKSSATHAPARRQQGKKIVVGVVLDATVNIEDHCGLRTRIVSRPRQLWRARCAALREGDESARHPVRENAALWRARGERPQLRIMENQRNVSAVD